MKPTKALQHLACLALATTLGTTEAGAAADCYATRNNPDPDVTTISDSYSEVGCYIAGRELATLVLEEIPVYTFKLRAKLNGSSARPVSATAFAFDANGTELMDCHIWPETPAYTYTAIVRSTDYCYEEPERIDIYGNP